jgi:site-specific DNA-methyltransferase (adenine-specific)
MSDPRGKLMPAHYTLLYYTRPGANTIFNYSVIDKEGYVSSPDSAQYCLRASCVKKRKRLGDDRKTQLSDIWFDIHRIKHKRDRDAHPCQLPEKLMQRIITLTTNKDGMVFDPFCGTGTTALAAYKLGRHFVSIDIDSNYVHMATKKLFTIEQNIDLSEDLLAPTPYFPCGRTP